MAVENKSSWAVCIVYFIDDVWYIAKLLSEIIAGWLWLWLWGLGPKEKVDSWPHMSPALTLWAGRHGSLSTSLFDPGLDLLNLSFEIMIQILVLHFTFFPLYRRTGAVNTLLFIDMTHIRVELLYTLSTNKIGCISPWYDSEHAKHKNF